MHRLSDDDLLSVFAALDVATLVGSVRGVCSRWRRLSADRDAWKHRQFSCEAVRWGEVHPDMATRVLQLAPCLKSLDIGDGDYDEVSLTELVRSTACAAEELRVELFSYPPGPPEQALRNQVSNGRLRRLSVKSCCVSGKEEVCRTFFRAVGPLRLEELTIDLDEEDGSEEEDASDVEDIADEEDIADDEDVADEEDIADDEDVLDDDVVGDEEDASEKKDFNPVPADCDEWRAGSLKSLRYRRKASETFFAFLLGARAASLEAVNLDQSLHHRRGISVPSLNLLARCSNLRQVAIPAVVELECLRCCPLLTSLTLDVSLRGVKRIQLTRLGKSIAAFFRTGVARLKQLKFINERNCKKSSALQCTVVAFGCYYGGFALLEDLAIGFLHGERAYDVLGTVLPEESLDDTDSTLNLSPLEFLFQALWDNAPRLRTLQVHNKPLWQVLSLLRDFPSLEVFTVTGVHDFPCVALSTGFEVMFLSEAVRSTPRLHFKFLCREKCPCARSCYRKFLCREKCPGPPAALGVFGHAAHVECSLHDRDVKWMHVDAF